MSVRDCQEAFTADADEGEGAPNDGNRVVFLALSQARGIDRLMRCQPMPNRMVKIGAIYGQQRRRGAMKIGVVPTERAGLKKCMLELH